MKAIKARKLAEKHQARKEDWESLLAHTHRHIRAAAERGLLSIPAPWIGLRTPVSEGQIRGVVVALISEGYIVIGGTVSW